MNKQEKRLRGDAVHVALIDSGSLQERLWVLCTHSGSMTGQELEGYFFLVLYKRSRSLLQDRVQTHQHHGSAAFSIWPRRLDNTDHSFAR